MNWESFFTALVVAIPAIGAAVLGVWKSYQKTSADAKSRRVATHSDHEAQNEKLDAMQASLDTLARGLEAAQAEATQLRSENEALREKNARLENKNDRLAAALPPTAKATTRKD